MFILRAIGRFFAKIGRWIKNTAWVQPLLIVGGIFAIIFSIPYISNWVSSWFKGEQAYVTYYKNHAITLTGSYTETGSAADALFTYMSNPSPSEQDKQYWGEKFFVVFVQNSCNACEDIYKGFQTLENGWGAGEFERPVGNTDVFRLYTIFVDTEETVNDETKNMFKDYFFNRFDADFEDLNASMQEAPYARNISDGEGYKSNLATLSDVESFKSPTILLFDPDYTFGVSSQLGVNEVLFAVNGKNGQSGPFPQARTLFDCWYHQDLFSPNYQQ